jgi:hypothetical protein
VTARRRPAVGVANGAASRSPAILTRGRVPRFAGDLAGVAGPASLRSDHDQAISLITMERSA